MVTYEYDTLSPPIICRSESPKPFLPGSVPNGNLDPPLLRIVIYVGVVECKVLDLKINTNCGCNVAVERVVCESQQQAALAHICVANQEDFEEIVVTQSFGHFKRCLC